MATQKKKGVRKRVEPHHRKVGKAHSKARRPRHDTLTLEKYKDFFREQITRFEDGKEFPSQQEYLDRRRAYVEQANLLALFSALQRCRMPVRTGFSFEDASLNPKLDPNMAVCEVPRWLLDAALKLLWYGLHGKWPKGKAGQTRAIREAANRWRDVVRTAHVLKARESGMPWDEVFEHVSATLDGAGTADTVEAAYRRVAKAFRADPTPYLFLPRSVPDEWSVDPT